MKTVNSINEIVRLKGKSIISTILLNASEDLICKNLFCSKLLGPCVCKLERALDQYVDPRHLKELDLSSNNLDALPPSLAKFQSLEFIDLSKNKLSHINAIPWDAIKNMKHLKCLDLSDNAIVKDLGDEPFYATYPTLRKVIRHNRSQ